MDSLIFSLNAVLPIMIMVFIGYLLKKSGFVEASLSKVLNKLVFRIFLPVMLFMNVYKIDDIRAFDFRYVLYAVGSALILFAVSLPVIISFSKRSDRRGVLLQSVFRSNYALIGIPLAGALFGEQGEIVASLLSAVTIPVFNILAVLSLTLFNSETARPSVKKILLGIIKNPLIQGIFAGIVTLVIRAVLVSCSVDFRLSDVTSIYKVLTYLSGLATPLALISLGIQFEFSAIKELKREIIFGTLTRTVIVPALGLSVAYFAFRDIFTGAHFAAFVALFASPLAVSTVPMTQEMKGDSDLAGQLVVWSTLVSGFTIFLIAFVLKSVGVF